MRIGAITNTGGNVERDPNYSGLESVLNEAYAQAAFGKGKERHGANELFENQIGTWIQKTGFDYATGQSVKKIHESIGLPKDAAIQELLGAINYLAIAITVLEQK